MYNKIVLIDVVSHPEIPLSQYVLNKSLTSQELDQLTLSYAKDIEVMESSGIYMFFAQKVKASLRRIGIVNGGNDYPHLVVEESVEGLGIEGIILITNRLMSMVRKDLTPFVLNGEYLVVNDPKDIPKDTQLEITAYL